MLVLRFSEFCKESPILGGAADLAWGTKLTSTANAGALQGDLNLCDERQLLF